MTWRAHLKTEEYFQEDGVDRLKIVIPEMKDKDLWIPIRVLEDFLGYDLNTMRKRLEVIRELETSGDIEEVIGPIRLHEIENSEGVPYISFITSVKVVRQ